MRKANVSKIYSEYEKLMIATAARIRNFYGGDFDELLSESRLIFMQALKSYNPKVAKFSTWLVFNLNIRLVDYLRKEYKLNRGNFIGIDDVFIETYISSNKDFSVLKFLDGFTSDALYVINLFFKIPLWKMDDILERNKREYDARSQVRRCLYNRLRQLGWSRNRTLNTFNEIGRIINH